MICVDPLFGKCYVQETDLKCLELPLVIQYSCQGGAPCGGLHSKTTESPSVTTTGSVFSLGNLGTTVSKHTNNTINSFKLIAVTFLLKRKTDSLLVKLSVRHY